MVTGFKLTISMCSLIRLNCNLVKVLLKVLETCVPKDFVGRCGEIKLIAEKRVYAISALIANIARTKRRRTKSFGTQSSFTL